MTCAYCGNDDYARTPNGDETVVWYESRLYCSETCLELAKEGRGMKLFVVTTFSVIGDRYAYVIRHAQKPTEDELKAFLVKHGRDKSDYILCEWVQEVVEVSEAGALPIPKVSKKTLDKWGQP